MKKKNHIILLKSFHCNQTLNTTCLPCADRTPLCNIYYIYYYLFIYIYMYRTSNISKKISISSCKNFEDELNRFLGTFFPHPTGFRQIWCLGWMSSFLSGYFGRLGGMVVIFVHLCLPRWQGSAHRKPTNDLGRCGLF